MDKPARTPMWIVAAAAGTVIGAMGSAALQRWFREPPFSRDGADVPLRSVSYSTTVTVREPRGQILDAASGSEEKLRSGFYVIVNPGNISCYSPSGDPTPAGSVFLRAATESGEDVAICSRKPISDGSDHAVKVTFTESSVTLSVDGEERSAGREGAPFAVPSRRLRAKGGAWGPDVGGSTSDPVIELEYH